MALKEKKILSQVLICDSCGTDISEAQSTHLKAEVSGYIKKDFFEIDLCVDCIGKIGLKRRGRKPAEENHEAPKRRGRPRKAAEKEMVLAAVGNALSDHEWEASAVSA